MDPVDLIQPVTVIVRGLIRPWISLEPFVKSSYMKEFKRIDYKAYRVIKANPDFVDQGKFIGCVPGVDVGDEFRYRMEVAIVSLHKPSEAGIDFMSNGKTDTCILIVATARCGDYSNDMHNPEILTYCGHGVNVGRGRKEPEDQRLEKGNLALKSIGARNPVRVIRGRRVTGMTGSVFIYDGMYTVETFWQEKSGHGKLVFKFKLRRIPGQPQLSRDTWRKLGHVEEERTRRAAMAWSKIEPVWLCRSSISTGSELKIWIIVDKMAYRWLPEARLRRAKRAASTAS